MRRPKLLLPWGGTSVLGHLIGQWRALGAKQIGVVCAPSELAGISPDPVAADGSRRCLPRVESAPTDVGGYAVVVGDARSKACMPGIQAELDRLDFPARDRIINPSPERGMFSSIRCAAQWPGWEADLTHWAIVLGDQPHLQWQTLQRVLDFSAMHPARVCQPARLGHGRHPVLLPKSVFRQVANSAAVTLKGFLAGGSRRVVLCDLDDTGLDLDIDRPEDYRRALELAGFPPLH